MKIIAIDPGYERLGIAILEKNKGDRKETVLFSECFKTNPKDAFVQRLSEIGARVEELIVEFAPEALSIENLFLENNQKTAMRVAETRGVILYIAARNNLTIAEFTPLQVKSTVAGSGRADKHSMMKMIPLLVSLPHPITYDDEYDAIAIGLTFFAFHRLEKSKGIAK